MADFAVYTDIEARWRPLTSAEQTLATTRIGDASALLRILIPDLADRVAADADLQRLVTQRVVDAVYRSLPTQAPPPGAKSVQETIGNRSYGVTYSDSSGSGVFFTDDELAPLRPGSGQTGPALGVAMIQPRRGWAPPRRHCYGDWPAVPWDGDRPSL